jgi:hypothetical protein
MDNLNSKQEAQDIVVNYNQQKAKFLDELQPDDFRNAGSFNRVEIIIEEINEGFYLADFKNHDSEEFINKAIKNLFREDSSAAKEMRNLAKIYLRMKNKNFDFKA